MENKNIIFKITLEQYNKKYRNRRHRLLKYTKKQVEDFDKQYGHYVFNNKSYALEYSHYLLKNRKWALIEDTYHEIPKPIRYTWFRNLDVGVQAIICLLGVAGIASAITVPVILINNGGTGEIIQESLEIKVGPSLKDKINVTKFIKQKNGDFKGSIKSNTAGNGVNITSVKNNGVEVSSDKYTYNSETHELTLEKTVFTKNSEVIVEGETKYWSDFDNWYNYATEAQTSDIGLEKEIKLIDPSENKEQTNAHKVRLIDLDHDILTSDSTKKAHTTWEFANLISDNDGHSLAYQFNDLETSKNPNRDYLNSTIRYALNGNLDGGSNGGKTGSHEGEILAAQRDALDWSSTYCDKSILSMLPEQFKSTIKTVNKNVGTGSTYDETIFPNKLFIISAKELNIVDSDDRGYGSVYSYYADESLAQTRRMKKQVAETKYFTTASRKITCDALHFKQQQYSNDVSNFGGYNMQGQAGKYWTRSPKIKNGSVTHTFDIESNGLPYSYSGNSVALGISPCFCI